MRILPSDEHQSRKEKILQAVVHLFIKTGKPVGSSTILEHFNLNLSPATIRNVLADLERENFLTHPHTSAGRVPTDIGYQSYVNSIAHIQRLAVEEEQRIRAEYSRRLREIEDLLYSTTHLLSSMSQCAAFAMAPSVKVEKLMRVELIPVNDRQVVAILVSETGRVQNKLLTIDHVPSEDNLKQVSKYLNQRLQGLSFSQAEAQMNSELETFKNNEQQFSSFLEDIAHHMFEGEIKDQFYVDGTSNIFKFPEFQDYEALRNFAQLVDEKDALRKVLTRELTQKGLQVKIGLNSAPGLKDFSVVSSMYKMQGRPMGMLGILGPKRMPYERMIALVNTVVNLINTYMDEKGPQLLEEGEIDE